MFQSRLSKPFKLSCVAPVAFGLYLLNLLEYERLSDNEPHCTEMPGVSRALSVFAWFAQSSRDDFYCRDTMHTVNCNVQFVLKRINTCCVLLFGFVNLQVVDQQIQSRK